MLFDDLPEINKDAKNEKDDNHTILQKQKENDTPVMTNHANDIASDQQNSQSKSLNTNSLHHDHANTNADADSSSDRKKTKSLVESLGSAGTTMAFVPATLRKRKTSTSTNKLIPIRRKNPSGSSQSKPKPKPKLQSQKQTSTSNVHVGSVHDDESSKSLHLQSEIHNATNNTTISKSASPELKEEQEPKYKESQQLTDLHSSVRSADMYDPMTPNDYLAYKQRIENESLQANIQRQAQKTLEMQRKLREKIEDERRKALASGDFGKIVDIRNSEDSLPVGGLGRGRGRGRGVSNLPAWLIQKQKEGQNHH